MALVYPFFCQFCECPCRGKREGTSGCFKNTQTQQFARQLLDGEERRVPADHIKAGDIVVCEVDDIIPADGEVIEGIATVDESAITGESAPVIRESGGNRSAVTAGTRVVSDRIVISVTSEKGGRFLDKMIALIEGAHRQKTPNEIALNIVLFSSSIILIFTVMTLKPFADFSALSANQDLSGIITVPVLVSLLICLIPTTISALLSAIGIAGMDRLIQQYHC